MVGRSALISQMVAYENGACGRVRANSFACKGSTKRKGGVSVLVSGLNINHGLSRTRGVNACAELGRICFYSCSGCFPKHRMSGLLVPYEILSADHLTRVGHGKNSAHIVDWFIDYSIRTAEDFAQSFRKQRTSQENFGAYGVPEFRLFSEKHEKIVDLFVPAQGIVKGAIYGDVSKNFRSLFLRIIRQSDCHSISPFSFIERSMLLSLLKTSSSLRNLPSANCWREISTAFEISAFSRQASISSHVRSKSATLIITLVLRPFCVMTMGRCVRAVRSKQSLSVRRYSVKGTTSLSKRGRRIELVIVPIAGSPFEFEFDCIVPYSVPIDKVAA